MYSLLLNMIGFCDHCMSPFGEKKRKKKKTVRKYTTARYIMKHITAR